MLTAATILTVAGVSAASPKNHAKVRLGRRTLLMLKKGLLIAVGILVVITAGTVGIVLAHGGGLAADGGHYMGRNGS